MSTAPNGASTVLAQTNLGARNRTIGRDHGNLIAVTGSTPSTD
jgi:hypothetical protein